LGSAPNKRIQAPYTQNPSLEDTQPNKQGFCFSWDSDQPPRFTQEEISPKPESQLKQTRSSTKETDRLPNLSVALAAHPLSLDSISRDTHLEH